ncbi:MAG: hypothetical protein KF862_06635 [Chitinophagaceae bacterium]|nr:hypothetical protein [Chitinophagaceae bacterium]
MSILLHNIFWFVITFAAGEMFAWVVFYFIRKKFERSIGQSSISILKGILERFLLVLGLACNIPTVIVFFGALKLGTRLKEQQDSRVSNDYFLIGNICSAAIAIIDYLIYIFLAGNH